MKARWTRRLLAPAALAAALGACAPSARFPARPSPESLPPGAPLASETLQPWDAWLRHYVMAGAPDSALSLLHSRLGPRDALVRRLQEAVVLHQAGRWAESNAALAWAEGEAESRYTQSLSGTAGALLLNDASIAYVPQPAERAMVPYYRMLNHLALGDAEGAAVEARKAGAYFTRLRDAGSGEPCVGEGLVQYLAGLSLGRAAADEDALVSFRKAQRAYAGCDGAAAPDGLGARLSSSPVAAAADSGSAMEKADARPAELVVVVEHGWVAHRAHADVHVPIFPERADSVGAGNPDALAAVLIHTAVNLAEQAQWGSAWEEHPVQQVADALEGAYIMKLAWPVYRLESCSAPAVRVAAGADTVDAPVAGDLSAAVLTRWEQARGAALMRMVVRGAGKYMATRAVEKKGEKQGGEAVGWVLGRLANYAGNRLERADTRSWSLLPDRVSIARLVLPAGEHPVRIAVMDGNGEAAWIDLGTLTLAPGETRVVSHRVWGADMGDLAARPVGRRAPAVAAAPDPPPAAQP